MFVGEPDVEKMRFKADVELSMDGSKWVPLRMGISGSPTTGILKSWVAEHFGNPPLGPPEPFEYHGQVATSGTLRAWVRFQGKENIDERFHGKEIINDFVVMDNALVPIIGNDFLAKFGSVSFDFATGTYNIGGTPPWAE